MLRLTLRRIEEIEPGYGFDAIALHVRRADPLGAESLDWGLRLTEWVLVRIHYTLHLPADVRPDGVSSPIRSASNSS